MTKICLIMVVQESGMKTILCLESLIGIIDNVLIINASDELQHILLRWGNDNDIPILFCNYQIDPKSLTSYGDVFKNVFSIVKKKYFYTDYYMILMSPTILTLSKELKKSNLWADEYFVYYGSQRKVNDIIMPILFKASIDWIVYGPSNFCIEANKLRDRNNKQVIGYID